MANNRIRVNDATILQWLASGGDELLTLTSVGATAGRQGARHDFGTTVREMLFAWRFYMLFATAPVVDEAILLFWKTSDGTHADNDDGTGDAAVSSIDKLKNLHYLGRLIVDEASATPEFSCSSDPNKPIIQLHRYGSPVVWNATADAFSSTAADHGFELTPFAEEIE